MLLVADRWWLFWGIKFGASCSEVVNFASFRISVGISIVSLVVTALPGSNSPLLVCQYINKDIHELHDGCILRFVVSFVYPVPF